ncbi:MAG TPA: hypothetical protein PKE12_15640 [Kiritimatiellia bacterium]|nr:hypothetical protein [Kiritimatiellia bacterium]
MRRILAIAAIAIRSAIRSRMVVCLLGLLVLAVVGLPLSLKGDGTAEGQLRIIITYSLGAAFALLALASLWAGALTIAQEVEEKQIQMLAAKPVRRAEIWLGKWLGLMTVNAGLLLTAGLVTALLLPRELLDAQTAESGADWRAVFRPIQPVAEDYAQAARAALAERKRAGDIPEGSANAQALRAIQQELLVRGATVAPGARRNWTFAMPRAGKTGEVFRLRFRFSSSQLGLDTVRVRWLAGPPNQPDAWRSAGAFTPNLYQTIELPGELAAAGGRLVVSFINEDPAHQTLVFDPQDGLRLMLPYGSFAANYARALGLLLLRLGFLAALGVTAGALFSSPVALFMALALMLMSQLAGFTSEFRTQTDGPIAVMELVSGGIRAALRPLAAPPVLDAVATGMRVEPAWLLRIAGIQLLLYGGAFAALGATVLTRRELALPQA